MKFKLACVVAAVVVAALPSLATDFDRVRIVGQEEAASLESPHPIPRGEAGKPVWRETIRWPGASYIAVHFDRFELAPGERVEIRTPDGSRSYTFRGEGKPGLGGRFWATHVPGDTCEVVLYGNGREPGWGFSIDKFAHGFPGEETSEPGDDRTICGDEDGDWAKCYESSEPVVYDKSRAIARLLINGVSACTGWLVGCEGHLMTNAHCITNPADALNTDYEFMAEGACGENCSSFGACPGVVETSLGLFVQTGTQAVLDYTLVELDPALSDTYGYFKLRPEGPVVDERIYLNGHPAAWGKRFQIFSSDATDESGFCEIQTIAAPARTGCSAGGPVEAGYACDTQGGSSGSPVVAYSDHRVVALHHCGGCNNTGVLIQDVIADLGANLPACTLDQPAGVVQLDRESFGCGGTAGVSLRDSSLVGAGSQDVSISSGSEPAPETLTLTEMPPGSGLFRGGIDLTADPAAGGDGRLSVAAGDTITVEYVDADDGAGGINVTRSDSADVDCRAPEIDGPLVTRVTGSEATIEWTTDKRATSEVRYGTDAPPTQEAASTLLVNAHAVRLDGLTPCTDYVYLVRSTDDAGNQAEADNGGALHAFRTTSELLLTPVSGDTPRAIPDNDPAGVTSTIHVPDRVVVADVDVRVDITHPYDGDMRISLIAPDGTEIVLSDQRGDDGADFDNTIFDDEAVTAIQAGIPPYAGSYRPDKPLRLVDGIEAAGDWTLKIIDAGPTDFGTLESWSLRLAYAGACGVSAVHESDAPADACAGSGSGGNGIVEPGETVELPVTLRNDGTEALTGVGATLTSVTPGAIVIEGGAAYPDLAVGATGTSAAPHYALVVTDDVACGSTIDLQLDGASAEGAFVDGFSVEVGRSGIEDRTYASTEVPRPVPDLVTVTSTIDVTDTEAIRDVDVEMTITHTYVSDLDIFLIGPDGTRIELTTDNGGSGENLASTIFDDEAAVSIVDGTPPYSGRFRPEQPLAGLDGIPANGTWTLEITDDTPQDPGVLDSWSIALSTGPDLVCDPCAVAAPAGPVTGARWAAGLPIALTWDATPDATFYNVYRGTPADLASLQDASVDSCRRASTASTTTGPSLTEEPPSGSFYWYVIRAASSGGEGPAGDASAGPRQQQGATGCP